ncbi:MAG TPA: hypothetical protein VF092_12460 [Longimicrobium sp.]
MLTSHRIAIPLLFIAVAACGHDRPPPARRAAAAPPPTSPAAAAPDTDVFYAESPVSHESSGRAADHGAPELAADTGGAGDHLVLAVRDAHRGWADADAIVLVKPNGELRRPRMPSAMPAPEFPFARRWLDDGHAYTLLRAGRPAGRMEVIGGRIGCAPGVNAHVPRGLPPYWSGLATDLELPAGPAPRRRPTPAERRAMTALLRDSADAHGSTWDEGVSVAVDASPLPGGATVLAGSAYRRMDDVIGTVAWAIFVLAEGEGDAYRPALYWREFGDDANAPVLLDVLDLDRDGVPEIFTGSGGPHPQQYSILRRGPDGWRSIADAGGC